MVEERTVSYKCNRCGAKQDRVETINRPYDKLKHCRVNMVRDWSTNMNVTGVNGFCGKVG